MCVFFLKRASALWGNRGKGWWCLVDLSLSPLYPLSSWAILLTLTLSTSLVAQLVKNPCVMQETPVQSLVWDDPLEEGLTTHSSILAWRIPWIEEPSGLQSMGLQTVRHNWSNLACSWGLQPEGWRVPGFKGQSKQSVFMEMDQGVAGREGREPRERVSWEPR